MRNIYQVLIGLLIVLGACVYFLLSDEADGEKVLEMHCAAVMQLPVEEILRLYEAECGVRVKLNFGGSGQLYAKLAVAGGDLYLPADVSYIDQAKREGLVSEALAVSHLTAGLIVAEGNPKNVKSLSDLARGDVRVVMAARSAAVGKYTHEVLESAGLLGRVEAGEISKVGTVSEVAMQVEMGASDVGVVWDALMPQFGQCEFVRVPEFEGGEKYAAIGLLSGGQMVEESLEFARYLVASDRGAVVFRKHGFDVVAGEAWEGRVSK